MASTSTAKRLSGVAEGSPKRLEMPHELMENIFERLGDVEILNSAVKVCTTWWRICKDPAKWKVINMKKPVDAGDADYDLEALTKQAIHFSCGELIDISLEGFGTDRLLDHITLRSSKLNRLCLTNCFDITSSGLSHALKRVPQLEKLEIYYTSLTVEHTKVITPNCPQLKSFKLKKWSNYTAIVNDDDALAIGNNMPELRHLVVSIKMTDIGLQAILDGCPHLESLDVRACYNIDTYGKEVKLCKERIKKFKGTYDYGSEEYMDADEFVEYLRDEFGYDIEESFYDYM